MILANSGFRRDWGRLRPPADNFQRWPSYYGWRQILANLQPGSRVPDQSQEAAHDALWDWDIANGKLFYSSNWKLEGVEQYLDFEHRLRASTGEYRWIACSGRSVLDGNGRPKRLVGSITDVADRRLLQEQLLQEAMFDGLTGLAKAPLFKDRINLALSIV